MTERPVTIRHRRHFRQFMDDLHAAAKQAPKLGAVGFDAVKHLVLCQVERRPPKARSRCLSLFAKGQGRDDLGGQLHGSDAGGSGMPHDLKLLLSHHLKMLKLPTFLREYEKVAHQCATEGLDHVQFLTRLVELELIDRERRIARAL